MASDTLLSPWPPPTGLATQVVPHGSAVLTISGRTTISAPAPLIWSVLRDTSAYHSWNSFCPEVSIHSQPPDVAPEEQQSLHKDTSFTFGVVMNAAKPHKKTPTSLSVTDISTPAQQSSYVSEEVLKGDGSHEPDLGRVWRISWTTVGYYVSRGLKTERFSEIIDLGNGECEYRTWECQGGILATTVKWMYEKTLQEKFAEWCADLKGECERRVREEAVG